MGLPLRTMIEPYGVGPHRAEEVTSMGDTSQDEMEARGIRVASVHALADGRNLGSMETSAPSERGPTLWSTARRVLAQRYSSPMCSAVAS